MEKTHISISTVIPPPPQIPSLPPPPAGIEPLVLRQNFQPIQTTPTGNVVHSTVPLVNPRPVMPIPHTLASSPLSTYFPMPVSSTNLMTAAFTPTLGNPSNTIFMGSNTQGDNQSQ